MPTNSESGIPLEGQLLSDSDAIAKVLKAQARAKELEIENKALMKDRDMLLREFTDYRNARRQVPVQKVRRVPKGRSKVRVTVGDLHGMRMDRPAVDAFLNDLKEIMPDEILLGGDMVECGGWLSRHQPIGFQAQADYSYAEDIEAAAWFLDEVQNICPKSRILYLMGNHEDKTERLIMDMVMAHQRDAAFMMKAFSPESLLGLKDRGIEYYDRHTVYDPKLPPGWIRLGKILYTHELAGGKNAARGSLLKTAANVVYFHTHVEDTSTINFPGVGVVKAFNSGCLCTLKPIWRHSDPTGWTHGFGLEFIEANGEFLRIHIPIIEGKSYAGTMLKNLRK